MGRFSIPWTLIFFLITYLGVILPQMLPLTLILLKSPCPLRTSSPDALSDIFSTTQLYWLLGVGGVVVILLASYCHIVTGRVVGGEDREVALVFFSNPWHHSWRFQDPLILASQFHCLDFFAPTIAPSPSLQ